MDVFKNIANPQALECIGAQPTPVEKMNDQRMLDVLCACVFKNFDSRDTQKQKKEQHTACTIFFSPSADFLRSGFEYAQKQHQFEQETSKQHPRKP